MPARSNFPEWSAAMRDAQRQYGVAMRSGVEHMGMFTRDAVRRLVPPGAVGASRFPGYAATGSLKNSIIYTPVRKDGDRYMTTVGVDPGAPRIEQIKASAHEYGVVIRGRPWLVFQIQGEWKKVRRVRIVSKRFFRDGVRWGADRFARIMSDQIILNLPNRPRLVKDR